MPTIRIRNRDIGAISVIVPVACLWYLFGILGLRLAAGIALIYVLPMYLFFRDSEMPTHEKLFFSGLVSLAVFPSLVYWLGFVTGSIRISIVITAVLIAAAGLALGRIRRKHLEKPAG
ncbi:MAG: hypothetical protein ABH879_10070 [archaeon]